MAKETSEVKHMKYSVLYPTGSEQEYFPILKFDAGGTKINEIDVIERAVEQDKTVPNKNITVVLFKSPPGLGKTTLATWLARKYNCPYQVVNCVQTMTDLDLLGSYVLVGQETVWQDGPLPSIIRATNDNGFGILIVNEMNALSLNAQIAFNPLFDKQQCVVLTINNNELVRINKNAHLLVIASMNPDIMGVNELQDAVLDRANAVVYMDYPSPEREATLVSKLTGIELSIALQFSQVIAECRALKTRDHKITRCPSTRGILDWVNYSRTWGVELAYTLSIVNKYGLSEEEREALRLVARGKDISRIRIDRSPSTVKPVVPSPVIKTVAPAPKALAETARASPAGSSVIMIKKKRRSPKAITTDEIKNILDFWKAKKGYEEIEKITGRSKSVIHRYVEKSGEKRD